MITKVVLGVALVLIEFSITALSQNNSISSNNDTSSTISLPDVTTEAKYDPTTTSTEASSAALADFRLPENCSAYKVSFAMFLQWQVK